MEVYCTRPGCPRPRNFFADLDQAETLKTVPQKYCTTCGMPLILAGRYIPQLLLGQGGFGAAFLALDRYTPKLRKCVVKQFQPSGSLNPKQLALAQAFFEREAEVLEELGNIHPQIPDLYAFFQIPVPDPQSGQPHDLFYLVQEYIDGSTMEEELAKQGAFNEVETLKMLIAILQILQFVHEQGVIHRDIKPSNIMRHRNGKFYLLDFGAVKQIAKGGTGGSTGIYSLGFAPPEQVNNGTILPATDLYALAVTCVTLLTGKQPMELFDSYANQWNWQAHANVSDRVAGVLDRMLQLAPSQRFPSATDVLQALSSSPPPANPPAPPPPALVTPPSPPTLPPQPLNPTPSQAVVRQSSTIASFSTLEILAGAGFTGFEGSLIAIALTSWLQLSPVSIGLSLFLLGGLVFAQFHRIIEKWDLIILAGLTVALLFFFPALQFGRSLQTSLLISGLSATTAIAIITLFRLVYTFLKFLSKTLNP